MYGIAIDLELVTAIQRKFKEARTEVEPEDIF